MNFILFMIIAWGYLGGVIYVCVHLFLVPIRIYHWLTQSVCIWIILQSNTDETRLNANSLSRINSPWATQHPKLRRKHLDRRIEATLPTMSKEDSNTVAFTYLGTAETLFDLKIFGDFVRTVDPRPRQEVQEEYNRHFSNGVNFTFIQHEECAIQPPMDWEEEDTYDGGNFRLLRPVEDLNPYTRLKIGRITRSQRQYEFHVFYRRSQAVFDFDVLETVMSRLDKVGSVPRLPRPITKFKSVIHGQRIAPTQISSTHRADPSGRINPSVRRVVSSG